MASLADRLDACQERLIDLYEKDSNTLQDQLLHWQYVRLEYAILYRARQSGLTSVGHQVVPPLNVTKEKASQAITIHLSLQSLNASAFKDEPWTLQHTSLDMWNAPPKGCWKKKGRTVTVKYDGEDQKAMEYVVWGDIYIQSPETDMWHKVAGHVNATGLFYEVEGCRHYYVTFAKEAKHYGDTGTWEVHWGSTVIYHACASVSSTQDLVREVPPAAVGDQLHYPTTPTTCTDGVGTTETATEVPTPPYKRQRLHRDGVQQPTTKAQKHVDSSHRGLHSDPNGAERPGIAHSCNTAPVIHLQGEANKLKCFRYRLKQTVPDLYVRASSTWHWACGGPATKATFVTLWYSSAEQRAQFLARVHIPKGIQAMQGHMSMFM